VPNKAEAVNYLFYRQRDCIRNSVSMAAHYQFGHKKLMGKSTTEQLKMLNDVGKNWHDYRTCNKIGTFAQRQTFEREVPETGETCMRSCVMEIPFDDVVGFETMYEVVFGEKYEDS
jgi:tRNA(His) 5'-end guanylyltransferase